MSVAKDCQRYAVRCLQDARAEKVDVSAVASSGNLVMLAAMRRASLWVSSLASGGFLPTSRLIVLSITGHLVICRTIERESNEGSVPTTRTAEGMFFAARCRSGAPALGYPVARVQRPRSLGRRDASVRTGSPRLQQPRRQPPQSNLQKSRILRRIRNIGFSLGTLVQGLGLDDLCSFRG